MRKNRKISIVVLFVFIMTVLGGFSASAATLNDIRGHWAKDEIQKMIDKGAVTGYPDSTFKPDNTITRAEFMTIVNKAFLFNEETEISYRDVKTADWFFAQVQRAQKAGYITGYEDNTMRPNNDINRQEAALIVSRILNMDINNGLDGIKQFTDAASIPSWSKAAIGAVVKLGYMNGYPDKSFKPQNSITRAEAVVVIKRCLVEAETVYNQAGKYGPETGTETVDGNVMIAVSGVTLQNTIINGNLTIAATVGEGDFILKNVTVKGTTYVNGGGAKSGILDGYKGDIVVNKNGVRLVATGKTSVDTTTLNTYAKLEEDAKLTADGFNDVVLTKNISSGATTTVSGVFNHIVIDAAGVIFKVEKGSTIKNLDINQSASITGSGTIKTAMVNAAGVTIAQIPNKTVVAKGLTAIVGGKEVSGTYYKPSPPGPNGPGPVTPTVKEITSLDTPGEYTGDYRLIKLTADTILGPAISLAKITGTLYLDPGEDYDLTLQNIEANKIVIESGKTESITLVNVGVLSVLVISDESGVRIIAQNGTTITETRIDADNKSDISSVLEVGIGSTGSFGSIEVNAAGKLTFKGDFGDNPVKIAGDDADIKLDSTAKLSDVTISANAKVTADTGAQMPQVAVTGSSKVELSGSMPDTTVTVTGANANIDIKDGTTVGTVDVQADAAIQTGSGASVTQVQVNQAGINVELTGTGNIDKVAVGEQAANSTVEVNTPVNELEVSANITIEGDKAGDIGKLLAEEGVTIDAPAEVKDSLKAMAVKNAEDALGSLPEDPDVLELARDYQTVITALGSVNAIKALDSSFDLITLANHHRLAGAVQKIFTDALADAWDILQIGFASGDNADSITQRITLPLAVADYGVKVSWDLSPAGIILLNGTVNRPSDKDTNITATATLVRGTMTGTKVFDLVVKRKDQVALPIANPVPGIVDAGTEVSLATDTAGAAIYYTTDNTDPTSLSSRYVAPITINETTTIKAIAVKEGLINSGIATFNYIVTIPGKDATLKTITVNGAALEGFSPAIYTYNIELAAGTTEVPAVAAVANDANAAVTVTPATDLPGTAKIEVIAQDGITKQTYTINFTVKTLPGTDATLEGLTISKGTLTPTFASGTTKYTAKVENSVNSVTVTPTANDDEATITVNGVPVASRTASAAISLDVGKNTITIIVTAQDKLTKETYTVEVNRKDAGTPPSGSSDATLSNLTISVGSLNPAFSSNETEYTAVVSNSVNAVTVRATVNHNKAKVKIDSNAAVSGQDSKKINLSEGNTTVKIVVTAEDGTKETYQIDITRASKGIPSIVAEMQNIYKYIDGDDKKDIRDARGAIGDVNDDQWDTILQDLLTGEVKKRLGENEAKIEMVKVAKALGEIYYSMDEEELRGTLTKFKNDFRVSFQLLFGSNISIDDLYQLLVETKNEVPDAILDNATTGLITGTNEALVNAMPDILKDAVRAAINKKGFEVFKGKLANIGWTAEDLINTRVELAKKVDTDNMAELALGKALVRSEFKLEDADDASMTYSAVEETISIAKNAGPKSYELKFTGIDKISFTNFVDWYVEKSVLTEDISISVPEATVQLAGSQIKITPEPTAGQFELVAVRACSGATVAKDWIFKITVKVE